jgi:hypothetical protein
MATSPINGPTSTPASPLTPASELASHAPTQAEKPIVKAPLVRPFSLSLPPENQAAQTIIKNIDASSNETEILTKKSAKEEQLKRLVEEQIVNDQLLNGPGKRGV